MQSCLDTPILLLSKDFSDHQNSCLNPQDSFQLIKSWCKFQNIIIRYFFLDRMKKKKNTLYLCGEPNSEKIYITCSLQKAAFFYEEVNQGTSTYTFMWQDCINKCLIVINEPYFEPTMIEQLKVILEDTGTFVHKKMSSDEYLRPTTMIITSNRTSGLCPGSKPAIMAQLENLYDNLKAFPLLRNINKDLHNLWINLAAEKHLTDEEK